MTYGSYGFGILLLAAGAILHYAVTGHVSGLAIQTVGTILMLAGIATLILSALWDFGARRRYADPAVPVERERIVEREPYARY